VRQRISSWTILFPHLEIREGFGGCFGEADVASEEALQAGIASAPDLPAWVLAGGVGDGLAEFAPLGHVLALCRLEQQPRRPGIIVPHQPQALLDKARGVASRLPQHACIDRAQVGRDQQAADQQQYARKGAQQKPRYTVHHHPIGT
jgi:hypothetical protein